MNAKTRKIWTLAVMIMTFIIVSTNAGAQSITMPEITGNLSEIRFALDAASLSLPQDTVQEYYENHTIENSTIIVNSTVNRTYVHEIRYYCYTYLSNVISKITLTYNVSGMLEGEINITLPVFAYPEANTSSNQSGNDTNNDTNNDTVQEMVLEDAPYVISLDCDYDISSEITIANTTLITNITTSSIIFFNAFV